MKHLIGIPAEKNISGLPPAKIFICNTGLNTGLGRLSSVWAGLAELGSLSPTFQQLGQTVANFCTRRHCQSSTLSLWLTSYPEKSPSFSSEVAFKSMKFILIKNNL